MSGKPAKKAAAAPVTKKKKRTVRKKVASSTARKKSVKASRPKKKAAKNKAVTRKAAAKKTASKKTASKKTGRKKTTKKTVRKRAAPPAAMNAVAANDATSETKSISWMSAQAASALKAVKASQAEKGQAVLAKNRKRGTEQHDDASLIEIAERMPVDDAALMEFSTEEAHQASAATGAAVTPTEKSESPPVMPPPPPVQPGRSRWPALLGLALVTVILGYSFWPEGDNSGVSAATDATRENHVPVVTAPADVATPDASTAIQFNDAPATVVPEAWSPARMPPVVTTTSPAESTSEPDRAEQQPAFAQPATSPAAAPETPTAPAATAPAATAPAPGRYRAPGYGYYPQTRQPAYPQQYYRQYR